MEEPVNGCFNKIAQNPDYGKHFDEEAENKIFEELDKDWCKGLSFLGGEPLSKLSDNRKTVIAFAEKVKKKYPEKDFIAGMNLFHNRGRRLHLITNPNHLEMD